MGVGIVSPLMPVYAQSMGASGFAIGFMFSAFSIARVAFMPYFGKLSDRKGRRNYILAGIVIYSIVSLGYVFSSNIYELIAVRFLNGFGSAMVIPIAMAYLGEVAPRSQTGRYMGTFSMAMFLGFGTGPFLGGTLSDIFGMNFAFYTMFGLSALAFIFTALFLPEAPEEIKRRRKETESAKLTVMIKDKVFKGLFLFRLIMAMGRGGIMAFLPLLAAYKTLSGAQVGVVISANLLFSGALQRYTGSLADRLDRFWLIIFGSSVVAVSLLYMPFSRGFWDLLAANLFMGSGAALSIPAATAVAVDKGDAFGMGASMGMFNMAMSLGMILAPIISGVVLDILGIKEVFLIAATISFIGLIVFSYFARGYKQVKANELA